MSKTRFSLCALVVCLLVAISLGVSAKYRKLRDTPSASLNESTDPQSAQNPSDDVPQGLLFELRPAGFIPTETEVSAGNYMLLLQNRSGMKELNFTLERENQGRMAASDRQRRDWTKRVQLVPGTYILGEANHPEWKAVIRVTAR